MFSVLVSIARVERIVVWDEVWIAVIDESGEVSSIFPTGGEVEYLLVGECCGEPVEQQCLGAFTGLRDVIVDDELPDKTQDLFVVMF